MKKNIMLFGCVCWNILKNGSVMWRDGGKLWSLFYFFPIIENNTIIFIIMVIGAIVGVILLFIIKKIVKSCQVWVKKMFVCKLNLPIGAQNLGFLSHSFYNVVTKYATKGHKVSFILSVIIGVYFWLKCFGTFTFHFNSNGHQVLSFASTLPDSQLVPIDSKEVLVGDSWSNVKLALCITVGLVCTTGLIYWWFFTGGDNLPPVDRLFIKHSQALYNADLAPKVPKVPKAPFLDPNVRLNPDNQPLEDPGGWGLGVLFWTLSGVAIIKIIEYLFTE